MMAPVLWLAVFLSLCTLCHCQSGEDYMRLMNNLSGYDRFIPPIGYLRSPLKVKMQLYLMSLYRLDMRTQKLISSAWLEVEWFNMNVQWNPRDFAGIDVIQVDRKNTWRPRITVHNTLTELHPIGDKFVIVFATYAGLHVWYPAEIFQTFCKIDVTYYPFDTQNCKWEVFTWSQNASEVILSPKSYEVKTNTFAPNGEWEIVRTRAWSNTQEVSSGENHSVIQYEITIRRRPMLLSLTVVLPVMVLSWIGVCVFYLPAEAGERVTYSVTVFLSFGVFLSFMLDSMPPTTHTLSILAVYMSCLLVLSAIYVLCCILSLHLFHKDNKGRPVPDWLHTAVKWLEFFLRLNPNAQVVQEDEGERVEEENGNMNENEAARNFADVAQKAPVEYSHPGFTISRGCNDTRYDSQGVSGGTLDTPCGSYLEAAPDHSPAGPCGSPTNLDSPSQYNSHQAPQNQSPYTSQGTGTEIYGQNDFRDGSPAAHGRQHDLQNDHWFGVHGSYYSPENRGISRSSTLKFRDAEQVTESYRDSETPSRRRRYSSGPFRPRGKSTGQTAGQNSPEMTWRRVSYTLDTLFFTFFCFVVLASNVVVVSLLYRGYTTAPNIVTDEEK